MPVGTYIDYVRIFIIFYIHFYLLTYKELLVFYDHYISMIMKLKFAVHHGVYLLVITSQILLIILLCVVNRLKLMTTWLNYFIHLSNSTMY